MRLSAKAPIVIRGEEITHLDADGYKHLPRATSLPDGKVLATSGGKWAPGDLSGISVSSVFGRTGAVAAQTGDYTPEQVGAEPYAGVPAATSFWRSTAAGVRAWVQLVAADITDLATTLAGYLTKANPTFTGTLTGPTATLTGFGTLRDRVGNPAFGALYAAGVTPATANYALAMTDSGTEAYLGASDRVVLVVGGTSKLTVVADEMNLASGMALKMAATTVIDSSRNITGTTLKGSNLTGTGNRPLVAGADGTIDDQDAAAFRDTVSVPPALSLSGTVDAKAINSGKAGLYRLAASTYTNFWTGITAGQQASVLQLESPTGLRTLIASDNKAGGLLIRFRASDFPGDGWSDWYTLWDAGNLPVGVTGRAVLATTTQAAARAAISAAKAPSKLEVSASTTIGSIDASAIKVTTTDVNLTLSGGVDGQGWDIVCPTTSFGVSIPAGVALYAYAGSDIGPTTRAVGGGRGIRIVRIDAATWIAPNLTW